MKFNFRKVSAIASSVLMIGMTAGLAAAANYPAPFVVGGNADVAIVYGTGTGVSALDAIQGGNLQSNLQSFMGVGSGTTTSTTGETVSLDTSGTRIWLNTSLNTAKSTLTESNLPTVLGDTTFSGNVDAKITSTLKFQGGLAAGGVNSGKVIFAKQPKSSFDPVIGISIGTGTGGSNILYNATATFKSVKFNNSDSEGESITLFGREFVVSTATDATDLVLFSSAESVSMVSSKENPNPSVTVNVAGTDYTVTLVTGTSTTATVAVDGEQKEINEGSSKKIGGIDIAIKSVTESTALDTVTATLLVGSEKITFTDGSTVTKGSDDDPVRGTLAYVIGGPSAATEITVAVSRPDNSDDAIGVGESFVDPVFGSFKIDFVGLNSPLDDTTRDKISILNSGEKTLDISLTTDDGDAGSFEFAHNQSGQWRLGDDSNNTIFVREFANVTEDEYIFIGNEDYGHLLEVTDLFNSTGGDHTKHRAKFQDVISLTTYDTTFTSDTAGDLTVDGKTYTLTFNAAGGTDRVQVKYPTGDSSANQMVLYPTMQTQRGARVAIYEPLVIDLSATLAGTDILTGFRLPDGDGYTSVAVDFTGNSSGSGTPATSWSFGGIPVNLSSTDATGNHTAITIGRLTYNFTSDANTVNFTKIYLVDPRSGSAQNANIDQPALILFEEKDDSNNYEAIVVDLISDPAGSSTDAVRVNDILFSSPTSYSATLKSDSDIEQEVDWWGTLVSSDSNTAGHKTSEISYPDNQLYAQIFVGEVGSSVSGGVSGGSAQLGEVLVRDNEVSSVSSKNLIVIGGSCINSAAANLLGGASCGSSFTDATGVGSGQFLIQSFGDAYSTGKIALLVAGFEAPDTTNAGTYLRNQVVDTAAGNKYTGTSSTSASMVTSEG